jgi:hypothetical protein
VHDTDGAFVPPKQGARSPSAGLVAGTGVPIGLVDKGSFVVDELTGAARRTASRSPRMGQT